MAYTTVDDSDSAYQNFLYTGSGNTGSTIPRTLNGDVDMKPGMIWMAKRGSGNMQNIMENEILGPGYHWLQCDTGDSKGPNQGNCASFDTNGFTHSTVNQGSYYHNESGVPYVCWLFKETGVSSVSNTSGTITSSVRADTTHGISYVRWTGTGANGTIGHGLGKRPKLIQMVPIQVTANNGNTNKPWWWDANTDDYNISGQLNAAYLAELNTGSNLNGIVTADRSGEGTSSVFTVKQANSSYNNVNETGQDYLAICHSEVQGFKRIGEYLGNGSTDGQYVWCGFKPAVIWVRAISAQGYTLGFDSARNPYNKDTGLAIGMHGASNTEYSDANTKIDFLSNGFKWRQGSANFNASGVKYAFFAVAENPFVTSTGVPTTAR